MEGCALRPPEQPRTPPAFGWRDAGLLAALLAAAVSLRAWLLCHTEVAARDSIGFIKIALLLEQEPWRDVLREHHQHPGYPLTVLAVSWPVRALSGASEVEAMRLSAQLAASLAAVLLVVPMYFLGRRLFHRAAGFWAALLFQCLPVGGRVLSDGISEPLFLLLTATALLLAARALERRSALNFALCGAFCGLAYLTRPEGVLLVAATLGALVLMQWVPAWRRSRRELLGSAAVLTLAALLAGSPYYLATGRFTNKPSVHGMMNVPGVPQGAIQNPHRTQAPAVGPAGWRVPLAATVPAVMLDRQDPLLKRVVMGLWSLAFELVKAFHYVAWAPALIGAWWYRGRVWTVPGMWVAVLLSALFALVLWRLVLAVGYLSDRHVLVLALCGSYPAAAALCELPRRLAGWLAAPPARARRAWVVGLVFLALLGLCLPRTLQPLHARRAGYHAAGLWLADRARPDDKIFDRHAWAYYYAGRVFQDVRTPPARREVKPEERFVGYHVIGKSRDSGEVVWNRELFLNEDQVLGMGGTPVWHWPHAQPLERASVVVYVVPRPGRPARVQGRGGEAACEDLRPQ